MSHHRVQLWPSEVTSCSPNQHLLPCPQPPTWPRAVTSPLSNLPPASDNHRQAYFRDRPLRVLPQVAEGGEGLGEESSAKTAVSVVYTSTESCPDSGLPGPAPTPVAHPTMPLLGHFYCLGAVSSIDTWGHFSLPGVRGPYLFLARTTVREAMIAQISPGVRLPRLS